MIEIQTLIVGALQTNCYIVKKNQHAFIVDPGSNPKKILEAVQDLHVEAICLTHGHFDHIKAVDALANHLNAPIYISKDDKCMLIDSKMNCSAMMGTPFTLSSPVKCYPNHELRLPSFNIEIKDVPGHTLGSVLLIVEDAMFSGDTLFKQGIGRTDLPHASNSQMVNSLNYIRTFTQDYQIYPGHGEMSTLFEEFALNPYLN